jgi:hypothetical protein
MSSRKFVERPDFNECDDSVAGLRYKRDRQMATARTDKARGYRYSGYVPAARYFNRHIVAALTGRAVNLSGYRA